MSVTPSIEYRCPNCGAVTIYMLVPIEESKPRPVGDSSALPSLDFSCAKCGTSETYMLSVADPAS
jgi:predicted RNA-binding Zn-ribbon protein involved in translation (DUF1610 family)